MRRRGKRSRERSADHLVHVQFGRPDERVVYVDRGASVTSRHRYELIATDLALYGVGDHNRDRCGLGHYPRRQGSGKGGDHPDGKHAYVTNYRPASRQGTTSVITTATGKAAAPITVGRGAEEVAITADGKHAYVTNVWDGTVSVITTATRKVSAPIFVGIAPVGVAIFPDGKRAYVTNGAGITVSVITTATGKYADTITVGKGPVGVAICPARIAHRRRS